MRTTYDLGHILQILDVCGLFENPGNLAVGKSWNKDPLPQIHLPGDEGVSRQSVV